MIKRMILLLGLFVFWGCFGTEFNQRILDNPPKNINFIDYHDGDVCYLPKLVSYFRHPQIGETATHSRIIRLSGIHKCQFVFLNSKSHTQILEFEMPSGEIVKTKITSKNQTNISGETFYYVVSEISKEDYYKYFVMDMPKGIRVLMPEVDKSILLLPMDDAWKKSFADMRVFFKDSAPQTQAAESPESRKILITAKLNTWNGIENVSYVDVTIFKHPDSAIPHMAEFLKQVQRQKELVKEYGQLPKNPEADGDTKSAFRKISNEEEQKETILKAIRAFVKLGQICIEDIKKTRVMPPGNRKFNTGEAEFDNVAPGKYLVYGVGQYKGIKLTWAFPVEKKAGESLKIILTNDELCLVNSGN